MAPRVNPDQPRRDVLGWTYTVPHYNVVLSAQAIITQDPTDKSWDDVMTLVICETGREPEFYPYPKRAMDLCMDMIPIRRWITRYLKQGATKRSREDMSWILKLCVSAVVGETTQLNVGLPEVRQLFRNNDPRIPKNTGSTPLITSLHMRRMLKELEEGTPPLE